MISNIIKSAQALPKTTASLAGKSVAVGFAGLTFWSESHSTGKEYGQGTALLKSAMYLAPTGLVGAGLIMGAEIGYSMANEAYKTQMNKKKSSFTRGFNDPFGNAATMRQRSQYVLQRGRSSLGSEARLFH